MFNGMVAMGIGNGGLGFGVWGITALPSPTADARPITPCIADCGSQNQDRTCPDNMCCRYTHACALYCGVVASSESGSALVSGDCRGTRLCVCT